MNQYEKNRSLLTEHFRQGCKLDCIQKLGLEVEHFVVRKDTKESISYYGEKGMEVILKHLEPSYPHSYYEGDHLLGLYNSDYSLTLEPAAQLEISINPRCGLKHIRKIYEHFVGEITPILDAFGYELINQGYQPASCVHDLPMIPKKRYDYMNAYFETSGTAGMHMMRGTASTQISVDYFSEDDFIRKIRAAYLLMPAVKFLCDCTPVFEGKPYEAHMARTMIWKNVDPKRCGIVPGLFDADFSFEKYADYLMNLPLIFLPNDGHPIYTEEKTAAELWKEKDLRPEDVEHILSMTFVDVRLKHYLEIRGADCMPLPYVMAYLALVKGIFFHREALDRILELPAGEKEILQAEDSLMEKGYEGEIYGRNVSEYLTWMLSVAGEYLSPGDKELLKPFAVLVKEKRSLSDYV